MISVSFEIEGGLTSFERGGDSPFLKMPSLEPTILDSFNPISNLLFKEGCLESGQVAATEDPGRNVTLSSWLSGLGNVLRWHWSHLWMIYGGTKI